MVPLTVDARRLLCPMPLIRLQNAIKGLPVGQPVAILCTDPGVKEDIPTWCRMYRHTVESIKEDPQTHEIQITVTVGGAQ